eukprot:CAMPEP_0184478116 /NCGR_PEP_ID=MMETSP0113_2-20130426/225_1 /TAXON_ID=91329 /ORGANISM="Norrisiella sphaerica, Strain BC52" /LENGTH=375 /DNA_ID=CAMNT_0026855795 /DNA_START=96 /DNA_END=1223 /DNA_ORIENTATION=+
MEIRTLRPPPPETPPPLQERSAPLPPAFAEPRRAPGKSEISLDGPSRTETILRWIADITLMLRKNSLDAELYANRSAAYLELKEFDKAATDANRCVLIKPDWAMGYLHKARALLEKGAFKEAREACLQGIVLHPDDYVEDQLEDCLEDIAHQERRMETGRFSPNSHTTEDDTESGCESSISVSFHDKIRSKKSRSFRVRFARIEPDPVPDPVNISSLHVNQRIEVWDSVCGRYYAARVREVRDAKLKVQYRKDFTEEWLDLGESKNENKVHVKPGWSHLYGKIRRLSSKCKRMSSLHSLQKLLTASPGWPVPEVLSAELRPSLDLFIQSAAQAISNRNKEKYLSNFKQQQGKLIAGRKRKSTSECEQKDKRQCIP